MTRPFYAGGGDASNRVHDVMFCPVARINQEYDQMERQREVQQRIDRSTAITTCRQNKMQERAKLVSDLHSEAIAQVMQLAKTAEYKVVLKNLILQASAAAADLSICAVALSPEMRTGLCQTTQRRRKHANDHLLPRC